MGGVNWQHKFVEDLAFNILGTGELLME